MAIAAPPSPPMSAWLDELGRPTYQVMRFQTIAPSSALRMRCGIDDRRLDQPLADRLGDRGADHERRGEVEHRRPDDRHARREHAGRDHGGDRVGAVVEPVDEVEDQRDRDDRQDVDHVAASCSGVLDGDRLEHVAGVLDVVQRLLEVVVDLLPLDHGERVRVRPRTGGRATRDTASRPPPRAASPGRTRRAPCRPCSSRAPPRPPAAAPWPATITSAMSMAPSGAAPAWKMGSRRDVPSMRSITSSRREASDVDVLAVERGDEHPVEPASPRRG